MLPRMTPGEQTERLSAVVCEGGWNGLHLLDEDDIYSERVRAGAEMETFICQCSLN